MALKQVTRVSAKYVFAKQVKISLLSTQAVFTCFFSDRYTMPLGIEDGRILSGHLRASSSYNYNHGPNRARLNIYASHGRTGAWVAKYRSSNQWLQIDLRQMCIIKGIATQGRREAHQWVKTFQLSYSRYGTRFRSYVSYGRVKVILLTLQTLVSKFKFSFVVPIRLLSKRWGEVVEVSIRFTFCDQILNSRDLFVLQVIDVTRRNFMLITIWG